MKNETIGKQRLLSLDVLRGLTMAGMIFVNNGAGPFTYAPLQHAKWNGLTLADVVFPFFLFMVGISTYLSLTKFSFKPSVALLQKIFKRTCLIILITWCLYWIENCLGGDFWPFAHLRLPGVLPRIAVSYCMVSLIAIYVNHKFIPWLVGGLLVIYSFVLIFGNGYYNDSSNILAIVDRAVFGQAHLYQRGAVDPEGLMGVIPSVAHTLIGFCCGYIVTQKVELSKKIKSLFLLGAALVVVSILLNLVLSYNKRIWSPSFVLVTCGLASCLLSLFTYIIDEKDKKKWTTFFVSFGVNPLFIYVVSELMCAVFSVFGISDLIYSLWQPIAPNPYITSMFYATTFVLLNWVISYILYKKRIYIKL